MTELTPARRADLTIEVLQLVAEIRRGVPKAREDEIVARCDEINNELDGYTNVKSKEQADAEIDALLKGRYH